jgi:glycerol-3-phosphate cytidylyltransferase
MSILEQLYKKYGNPTIDAILDKLNHGDRNFAVFYQYISTSDRYNPNNFSHYKSTVIPQLNALIDNRYLRYELINILSDFNVEVKMYNTCITYGTFDLFHVGHLNLLRRAKEMCNTLIVAVSTDAFNETKGKHCVISYNDRSSIVSGCRYVDKVIPETDWEQKISDITQYHADCFVIGDDWKGKFDYLNDYCDVLYLSRTDGISTTQLKGKLQC